MKKAAKIVAVISLVLDYIVMIGAICFGIYLFLNAGAIVNSSVSSAMNASSSGGAAASTSSSSVACPECGRAIGGAVMAFGSALILMMVILICFIWGIFMIFPIVTMHIAIKKLAKATCRKDMLAVSIVAIFGLQIPAAIMFLAIPDDGYNVQ